MSNRAHTVLRFVMSLVLAGALLVPLWLYGKLEITDLTQAVGRLSAGTLVPALALYAGMYVLRTIRFRYLIPAAERPAFVPLLGVTAAYTMAATLLPAKIGEATFVLYSKRVCNLPATSGLAALIVSRLLDLASLTGGFSIACFALAASDVYPAISWFTALGLGLAAVSAVCFFLSARGNLVVLLAIWLVRTCGLERGRLGKSITAGSEQLAGALRLAGRDGMLLRATLVSIPIWLSTFMFCALLGRGFGLPADLSLAEASFGSGLAIVTSLAPVSAFANFGTLEAGWVLGFEALGVPRDVAAVTGLGLHVVQVASCIVLGLIGHMIMGSVKRA
ncbi:MAG: flippase-like domain-containing protein [Planctomycetes bacterium]|nr:flippase-like domain-containing protein [Planctomycetota bacterium]